MCVAPLCYAVSDFKGQSRSAAKSDEDDDSGVRVRLVALKAHKVKMAVGEGGDERDRVRRVQDLIFELKYMVQNEFFIY